MAILRVNDCDEFELKLSTLNYSTSSINMFNIIVDNSILKNKFIDNKTQTIQEFIKWLELPHNEENQKEIKEFRDYSGNFIAYVDEYNSIVFEIVLLRDNDKIISTYSIESFEDEDLINFIEELKNEHINQFKKIYISKKNY